MMQTFTTIPFNAESGLWKANGIAKFSPAGIILEFENKLIGLVSTGVKEARIPFEEVFDIKFRKGIFRRGARILIRTKTLAGMQDLPLDDGKLKLKIQPDDFELARDTVAGYQKMMADHNAALPPAQASVSALFDESEDITKQLKHSDEN